MRDAVEHGCAPVVARLSTMNGPVSIASHTSKARL